QATFGVPCVEPTMPRASAICNLCPHKMQMALARGMVGSTQGTPKVACPFHKKTFSLKTGECLNADECSIAVFPVRIEDGYIHIGFAD
ncbi:MAG TPA: nitrite reductase (NAD(P)H) small subunit, partial [Ohtaekwangia sp.]|nr:nitrite reductase (NAD(P)H) small subunit [Ohtaekwangia sp.]